MTSNVQLGVGGPQKLADDNVPSQILKQSKEGSGQGSAGWPVRIGLGLLCVLWVIPALGLLLNSFRPRDDQLSTGWWTVIANPLSFTLDNYKNVLSNQAGGVNMGNAFINSLAVALPATIIPILVACFAAYAFTFMQFKGRDTIFVVIVGLLVIPNQVALVPLLNLYRQIHLSGTFPAVWLAHIGFGMPLAVYIFRNYMSSLPMSLIESAKIDGASHFTTFWRLIIPLSTPAIASFAIFQFIWVWNDLLVALLFLGRGDNTVVTVALQGLQGQTGQGVELIGAAGFVAVSVPVLVFLSLQRFFIRGMTSGAVKG